MSDLDETGDSLEDLSSIGVEGTFSAGEVGRAVDADEAGVDAGLGDVIIGEIPDAHNLSHMLWTARCTVPSHGLLGTFENREMAEDAKRTHLVLLHGRGQLH
jgi:hypothetical protein